MTTHTPQQASDFEAIYWPNATCGVWDGTADCHQPGVVLAYDVFSPEVATWFCREHWPEYEEIMSIVEDRREKEATSELRDLVSPFQWHSEQGM